MESTIQLVLGLPFRLKLTGKLTYLPRVGEAIFLGKDGFEVISDKHPDKIVEIRNRIVDVIEQDAKLVLVITHIYHEFDEGGQDVFITVEKSDKIGRGYSVFEDITETLQLQEVRL
ncbi:hypothetical protein QNI19_20490 [Cytophagaceae bacterium DM2B3-1]|uniref:Uncharacterized protein n=1 Tax=Xanthocytophaga flava TaxID=3048013 RepID=A0AAE3QYF0_9BACT|nr:hypothetical protein [Xanthocytophaga flavus]MDJ1472983.1 hypothetical protein [Xanthocytophaga flavus]MDJ1485470.1 hypothetical protein [Xanthocytophaga flavus]MDJ1495331.1 hypothetical protein [Xanthocytophaga flavus]